MELNIGFVLSSIIGNIRSHTSALLFILLWFGSKWINFVHNTIFVIHKYLRFGIGAVVSAAYYKALSVGDKEQISKVFKYSRKFFRIIGFILLAYIAVLVVVFPIVINSSFDFGYTIGLLLAMSLSHLAQYFVGVPYQILLNSDQKSYVQLIINGSTLILNTIACVCLMLCGSGIHLVKLTTSLIFLARPLAMSIYVKKNYEIDMSVLVDGTIVAQKKNGIIQHLAYTVYENTDVMVLTLFSTLQNVSIYSVYVLVTNSIKQIISAATTGIQALFGSMIAKDQKEELGALYSTYTWATHTICTLLFTVTGLLILPFVEIYTSGVEDVNYQVPAFAILITIAAFFASIRNCQYVLIRAAGHFKQTQTASLVECLLNLILSIILVFFFGLIGVAIGTVVATVFFTFYEVFYFKKAIISAPIKLSVKQFFVDIIVSAFTIILGLKIPLYTGSVVSWIIQAAVVTFVALSISLLLQFLFYPDKIKLILKKVFAKKAM